MMQERENETVSRGQAEAAAEWWADQFREGVRLDNDDQETSAFGNAARSIADVEPEPEQIDTFEKELADRIADMEHAGNLTLSVDYHPDRTLSEAAEAAGMDGGMLTFPWKTTMWITRQRVLVDGSEGQEPIYEAPDYPPRVNDIRCPTVEMTLTVPAHNVEEQGTEELLDMFLSGGELGDSRTCLREVDEIDVRNVKGVTPEDAYFDEGYQIEVILRDARFFVTEFSPDFTNESGQYVSDGILATFRSMGRHRRDAEEVVADIVERSTIGEVEVGEVDVKAVRTGKP